MYYVLFIFIFISNPFPYGIPELFHIFPTPTGYISRLFLVDSCIQARSHTAKAHVNNTRPLIN